MIGKQNGWGITQLFPLINAKRILFRLDIFKFFMCIPPFSLVFFSLRYGSAQVSPSFCMSMLLFVVPTIPHRASSPHLQSLCKNKQLSNVWTIHYKLMIMMMMHGSLAYIHARYSFFILRTYSHFWCLNSAIGCNDPLIQPVIPMQWSPQLIWALMMPMPMRWRCENLPKNT